MESSIDSLDGSNGSIFGTEDDDIVDLDDSIEIIDSPKPKKAKVRDNAGKNWFFTWNNPVEDKVLLLVDRLEQVCDRFCVQEEVGASGTPHLQGKICLKKKGRWSQFNDITTAIHWEKSKLWKGWQYCKKADTHVGRRWGKGCIIPKEIPVQEPYGWQLKIMDIIKEKPDDRTIYWFYEPNGKIGKSKLCKYLKVKHDALIVDGKASDAKFIVQQRCAVGKDPTIIIMDIPRCVEHISYCGIEQIKNGCFASTKYESGDCCYDYPHLIIFSNNPPDYTKLSSDRWQVFNIDDLIAEHASA